MRRVCRRARNERGKLAEVAVVQEPIEGVVDGKRTSVTAREWVENVSGWVKRENDGNECHGPYQSFIALHRPTRLMHPSDTS